MSLVTTAKAARNVVTSKVGRQILIGQKNSPHILYGVGVLGVVATAVLASKATIRTRDLMDKEVELVETAKNVHGDRTSKEIRSAKIEITKEITKIYTPTVLVGITTIGCITGSHFVLNKRYIATAASYAAVDQAFKEYRQRVIDLLGPEKERELLNDYEDRQIVIEGEHGPEIVNVPVMTGSLSPYAKLFGPQTSTQWQKERDYLLIWLKAQQVVANELLQRKGHLVLNDVYKMLGLEPTRMGTVAGWVKNNPNGGDNFVDFGIFADDRSEEFLAFMRGHETSIWLDFNVDGNIYDLLDN